MSSPLMLAASDPWRRTGRYLLACAAINAGACAQLGDAAGERQVPIVSAEQIPPAPARTFHALLASEPTPCPDIFSAFEALWDVRAKFKTAWRFCFSPHDLQGSGAPAPERRRTHEKDHEECEKCRRAVAPEAMLRKVQGRTHAGDMPGFGGFADEELAAVLTYIRREWEHPASPIEPAQVAAIRAAAAGHSGAWRAEELRWIK